MGRYLHWLWWLGVLSLLGLGVQAEPVSRNERVVIVSSGTAGAYAEAAQALVDGLVRADVARQGIIQLTAAEMAWRIRQGQLPQPSLFVALGSDATQVLASAKQSAPVLSALIPRTSFERILRDSGRTASSQLTALYLDQPLNRQLALIRLVWPQARRLGVLWGAESLAQAPTLHALAAAEHWAVKEATVNSPAEIFIGLKQVLDDSDVLLAVADPQVYNSNSLQNILLSAFRARVPMVAFSPAYARAGAVLSLHVTPAQAGVQAAALALDVLHGRPLPVAPVKSQDFEVTVNPHVARALGLSLDDKVLRQALRRLEQLP
ncbi:ABC transporter substrate binding protein [Rhodoferax sp.]|uniref:ABC transporter substrate-binding protein n=1 Tax=Rhodoferax sp. TaxID=50421 RepID=UPI0026352090|nr:ABC transporter substrate binding protein [Rhodoferax sp.]MDD2926162.1 ABC transporter substrate binding protein [Rhodoferax sp.]